MLLRRPASIGDIGQVLGNPPLAADEVVIVSGLPVLTDGEREADSDNPKGYYEYEKAKSRGNHGAWLDDAGGKVVKMVAQLLPNLPPNRKYRMIFMERPLG